MSWLSRFSAPSFNSGAKVACKNASDDEIFDVAGPKYLSSNTIDWENKAHQRAVASSLVNAVYVAQVDRQAERKASDKQAPKWWEFFEFELAEWLIDFEGTSAGRPPSYFGAVFRRSSASRSTSTTAPGLVFAIRGTSTPHDWGINVDSWLGLLDTRVCFKVLMEALERHADDENLHGKIIWLCGHSLGAAMAAGAGQAMAQRGIFLQTLLFNLPYTLDPTTKNLFLVDLNKAMRRLIAGAFTGVGITRAVEILFGEAVPALAGGGIGAAAVGTSIAVYRSVKAIVDHVKRKKAAAELFQNMTSWVPFMFVNPTDFLCKDYISYFEKRRWLSPPYLPDKIASAMLIYTLNKEGIKFGEAHGIMQWWREDLPVQAIDCRLGEVPHTLDERH